MSYVQLTTIQVSASGGPPGGQSVVLKCEVSEVSGDPVTLAWLRMEGRRGTAGQTGCPDRDSPQQDAQCDPAQPP
ncbi:hypothetical protein J4Q44_G00148980 [Coregonus suidteri]|uniref:Ig-like domain-containing protein n=1 Tax=Coregonus suidteri TaxID=861788 RepID=A0AAN8LSK3_9TELE